MSTKQIPDMNWDSDNVPESFKMFKQRLELFFLTKKVKKEDQVPHILLQIGERGLRMYNAISKKTSRTKKKV